MQPEYVLLFNAISTAIAALDSLKADLISAQQMAEDLYVERQEE